MRGGFLICGTALCLAATGAPPSPREFSARAERGEALTLAFFGGSLTWGANASDPETTSWRGRVMEGLRVRYPKARWRFVNAAIGGTGSELGAFRLERDVLSRHPDFVLLDFTLNDGLAGGRDGKDDFANRTYESIVRTCLAKGVGILPVCLTRKEFTEADDIGFLKRRVQHREMSRRYGTGFADVLGVLNADFRAGRLDTSRMWPAGMFDTCHPHDAGYAAYADAFFREWDRLLKEDLQPHLTEDWYSMPLTDLRRMDAKELAGGLDGARLEMPYCTANTHDWLCSRWMDDILVLGNGRRTRSFKYERCEPSAPLKVSFSGTTVALFTEVVPESVPFEVVIDGVSRGRRDFGTASISFCRHMVLTRDLPEGRHELEIRPALPANGVGVVRIGAVLAANSPTKTAPAE